MSLELLSLWDDIALLGESSTPPDGEPYDLLRGLALLSAALELSNLEASRQQRGSSVSTYRAGSLLHLARVYEGWLLDFLGGCGRRRAEGKAPGVALLGVRGVNAYVEALRAAKPLRRSESRPEDFSLVSAHHRRRGSEWVLNVLLLLRIRAEAALPCALVGRDLAVPWVRVEAGAASADDSAAGRRSPVFASWSYGAMTKADVERLVRPANRRWSRERVSLDDPAGRKSVLLLLLEKQLFSLSSTEVRSHGRATDATTRCKEQLIHLLTQ